MRSARIQEALDALVVAVNEDTKDEPSAKVAVVGYSDQSLTSAVAPAVVAGVMSELLFRVKRY